MSAGLLFVFLLFKNRKLAEILERGRGSARLLSVFLLYEIFGSKLSIFDAFDTLFSHAEFRPTLRW